METVYIGLKYGGEDEQADNDGEGEPNADFFRFTAFGRIAEFAKDYLHKGTKIVVIGHVQNDNYTDQNGNKVYRDSYIADEIEFAESRKAAEEAGVSTQANKDTGFMSVPDTDADDLPFV